MEQLIVIRTLKELKALSEFIKDKEFIAWDTETTGLTKDSKIIGFSIAADIETAYYVILAEWNKDQNTLIDLETLQDTKEFFNGLLNKSLICHNGLFDAWMVENNFQVKLMPYLHTDTMILAHLLDENRGCALKDLATTIYGESSTVEQKEMKESVHKNGGVLTKDKYELYKADSNLLAKYGAKDAILTMKLFYEFIPQLYEQNLNEFFYEESMPLYRGPTYDMNTVGVKIDTAKLSLLKQQLETELLELKSFIYKEIDRHVREKYRGTTKANTFNIDAGKQLAWLLYFQLNNIFGTLTKGGKELCRSLDIKIPYSIGAKRDFIHKITNMKGYVYEQAKFNPKTKKMGRPKKVADPWHYVSADAATLKNLSNKYMWVEKLLEYKKSHKLLKTYVVGIQNRMQYGILRASYLQHGTTSGRYACRNPNLQNLHRNDKRVKSCIIARPGKVFVGADESQLEPRIFASLSQDERLMRCFESDDDFYSVIGMEAFETFDCTPKKEGSSEAFGVKYKGLRDISKVIALSATYGTTAPKLAPAINKSMDEAQDIIDSYFEKFPKVKNFMKESHNQAISDGVVYSLFGRPRRIPKAKAIKELFGNQDHSKIPYDYRNLLNLSVNHRIQSTAASLMNRASIAFYDICKDLSKSDSLWAEVFIVSQIHDELVIEAPESISDDVAKILKFCMEETNELPGVKLIAEPKIGNNIAELK